MPRFMRGAKPSPRHRLAAAMPHVPTVTAPPQFLWHPTQLSIWGNDQFGDCTVAEEAFSKGASVGVFVPDDVVIAWARKHGAIEGDTLIDVLDKMKATGFVVEGKTFDDGQPLSIDWTNPTALQNAIAEGPVKIAVAANQLESAVPNPPISGWVATRLYRGSGLRPLRLPLRLWPRILAGCGTRGGTPRWARWILGRLCPLHLGNHRHHRRAIPPRNLRRGLAP